MSDEEEQEISWPEFTLPPINLNNSLPADDFYPDDEAPPNGGMEEDDAM